MSDRAGGKRYGGRGVMVKLEVAERGTRKVRERYERDRSENCPQLSLNVEFRVVDN